MKRNWFRCSPEGRLDKELMYERLFLFWSYGLIERFGDLMRAVRLANRNLDRELRAELSREAC